MHLGTVLILMHHTYHCSIILFVMCQIYPMPFKFPHNWTLNVLDIKYVCILFQILCSVDPRLLRLTPHDDLIYKAFREEFPNLDVKVLNEDEIKSPEGKEVWIFTKLPHFIGKFKTNLTSYLSVIFLLNCLYLLLSQSVAKI